MFLTWKGEFRTAITNPGVKYLGSRRGVGRRVKIRAIKNIENQNGPFHEVKSRIPRYTKQKYKGELYNL